MVRHIARRLLLAIPTLLAPLLGGWLVDLFSLRATFWVALVLCVAGWGYMRWLVQAPGFGVHAARA